MMMMMAVMKLSALANFCQMCEGRREGGVGYSMSNFTTCTIALTKVAAPRWSLSMKRRSQIERVAGAAEQGSHCWRRHLVACGVTHSVAIKQLPLPQRIFSHSKRFSFVSHFVSVFFVLQLFCFKLIGSLEKPFARVPLGLRFLLRLVLFFPFFLHIFLPCLLVPLLLSSSPSCSLLCPLLNCLPTFVFVECIQIERIADICRAVASTLKSVPSAHPLTFLEPCALVPASPTLACTVCQSWQSYSH